MNQHYSFILILNAQPSCSLSNLSCSQHCALTHCCAAFGLDFPTSILCRHVGLGAPLGLYRTLLFTLAIFWIWLEQRTNGGTCIRDSTHANSFGSPVTSLYHPQILSRCSSWRKPLNLSRLWTDTGICWIAYPAAWFTVGLSSISAIKPLRY